MPTSFVGVGTQYTPIEGMANINQLIIIMLGWGKMCYLRTYEDKLRSVAAA